MIYHIIVAVCYFMSMDWIFQFPLPFVGLMCDLGKIDYTSGLKSPPIRETGRHFSKKVLHARQGFFAVL